MRDFTTAETAAMMRKALKAAFPKTKFSVRSSNYSGGSSIRIRWTDGPTDKRVNEIVGAFEGKGFDGMIDLGYSIDAWVLNGEIIGTRSHGTVGSGGVVPAWGLIPPHDDAELVDFGGSYVFTERALSVKTVEKAARQVAAYFGVETPKVEADPWDGEGRVVVSPDEDRAMFEKTRCFWRELVRRAAEDRTRYARESIESTETAEAA